MLRLRAPAAALLLLAALLTFPRPVAAVGGRIAVLIKAHNLTAAQALRVCAQLSASNATTASAGGGFSFFLQLYSSAWHLDGHMWVHGDETAAEAAPLAHPCGEHHPGVSHLSGSALRRLWGNDTGPVLEANAYAATTVHELAWYRRHREAHGGSFAFDHLWVLEQDVAWGGDLGAVLGAWEGWQEDYLCASPALLHADGHGFWVPWNEGAWWRTPTSGSAAAVPATPWGTLGADWAPAAGLQLRHRCWAFMTRMSARMLALLADEYLPAGKWGQCEWWPATVCSLLTPGCTVRDLADGAAHALGTPFQLGGEVHDPRELHEKVYHPVKE